MSEQPAVPVLRSGSNLTEKLNEFVEIRKGWTKLGVDSHNTRIGQYERELRRLVELGPAGRAMLDEQDAANQILMFTETQEFVFMSKRILDKPHLAKSVQAKAIFSGTALAGDETNAVARNTMFELAIAGLYESAGLSAQISTITDVRTVFESRPILTECKRPQSFEKVEDNIRRAAGQLADRLMHEPHNALGVIAISFGKPVTGGTMRLNAPNAAALTERLRQEGTDFINRIGPYWLRYSAVSAVLAQISVSGITGEENTPFSATYFFPTLRPTLARDSEASLMRFFVHLRSGLYF